MFLLLLLPLMAGDCLEGCSCSLSPWGEMQECGPEGGKVRFRIAANDYVNIYCLEGPLNCDTIPQMPASNGTISSLMLVGCRLPVLACLVRRLGASTLARLVLVEPREKLMVKHVEGLVGLEAITLRDAEIQTTIPDAAVAHLPSLRSLRVQDAPIWLHTLTPNTLASLELYNTEIQALPPGAFSNLKGLTELQLWNNKFTEIGNRSFEGLDELRNLSVSHTPLANVSSALRSCPRLQRVTWRAVSLNRLARHALPDTLLMVSIKKNAVTLTLENGTFSDLQLLKTLSITKTPLAPLPSDLFQRSFNITTLELSECDLKDVPVGLFENQQNLETLDLKNNVIGSLSDGLFVAMKSLVTLDLRGNVIKALSEHTFEGLSRLTSLHLDHNRLATILDGTFSGARALRVLTLAGNGLRLRALNQKANTSPFRELYELQELSLADNRIQVVYTDLRTGLTDLRRLDLRGNQIRRLSTIDFRFSSDIVHVDFSSNNITTIEFDDRFWEPSNVSIVLGNNPYYCDCHLYPFLNHLRRSKLDHFDIDNAFCDNPPNLKGVALKDVPLASLTCIFPNCTENCYCTKNSAKDSLHLDCNLVPKSYPILANYNVSVLQLKLNNLDGALNLSAKVVSLNVSGLGLESVPKIPETVKELDLSYNKLVAIPKDISERKILLHLTGNAFVCSCYYFDNLKALQNASSYIVDRKTVTCADGQDLFSVNVNRLCDVWWSGILGGVLIGIGVLVIALAIFTYCYSKEIKLYMYLKGWDWFVVEDEVDGKTFDVLLSYSDDNERFVVENIVPVLTANGYKVCARYKDWDIGDWIPSKVADTVDKSRRTVVFLTGSYLHSIAALELKATKLIETREKRKRLIVVLEDLADEDDLKELDTKCLQLKDPGFWDGLKKRLPKRRDERDDVMEVKTQATLNVLMKTGGNVTFEMTPKKP